MVGKHERGDTLIEVLLGMVVLSIMIVGAITIMSRGLQAVQVALEHTQVRYEMSGQAELLRYLRDNYVTNPDGAPGQTWLAFVSSAAPQYVNTTAVQYDSSCGTLVTAGKTGFYLQKNLAQANPVTIQTFNPGVLPATTATAGQGMWIEAVQGTVPAPPPGLPSAPRFIDFKITACWNTFGTGSAKQHASTVVRLYDTR